jgi:hypothetical protein
VATVTTVKLIDDLTGGEAQETVKFALDGEEYEIDLSVNNAGVLRDVMGDFVPHARRVVRHQPPVARTRSRSTTPAVAVPTKVIREWAKTNGFSVSDRGRLHQDVLNAYNQHVTGVPHNAS